MLLKINVPVYYTGTLIFRSAPPSARQFQGRGDGAALLRIERTMHYRESANMIVFTTIGIISLFVAAAQRYVCRFSRHGLFSPAGAAYRPCGAERIGRIALLQTWRCFAAIILARAGRDVCSATPEKII